jgi:hypothetical protein
MTNYKCLLTKGTEENVSGTEDICSTHSRSTPARTADSETECSSFVACIQDEAHLALENSEEPVLMDRNEESQITRVILNGQTGVSDELLTIVDDATSVNAILGSSSLSMTTFIPPTPYLDLSLPIFQEYESSMLMHHYTNHIADILQPVLHPNNPWRTTYIPIALEGTSDVQVARNSGSISYAAIALSHSLQASAAFHLQRLTASSEHFHRLGVHHREKSLWALREALTDASDLHRYKVYMAAMLSLVTIDVSQNLKKNKHA